MSVRIFYDNTDFRLRGSVRARNIIGKVIVKEGKISGDFNFIFTNDESLREINSKFLNHDYFTDVITFGYNEENRINGEIYISIETVKINSLNYNVSLKSEVLRVMIHGVLHLLGYDDKREEEKTEMRRMEDYWLKEILVKKDGL